MIHVYCLAGPRTWLRTGLWLTQAIVLAVCLWASEAQSKVVAILFDTSTSMRGGHNLPAFGAKLLAATVDGRAGQDRVVLMNFNEYFKNYDRLGVPNASNIDEVRRRLGSAIKEYQITNADEHKRVIQLIEEAAVPRDGGTPYGPIEVMLDWLADELADGEEAYLIIVSDGEYTDIAEDGSDAPALRASLQDYKARLKGDLSIEYLFIDVDGNKRANIETQGVKNTLLEVFNGPASGGVLAGDNYVSNKDQLWETLTDIIARVSNTDREAQKAFVQYSGNTVSILDSPLSISRVVAVSTSGISEPVPKVTDTNFDQAPTDQRSLDMQMRASDGNLGASRRRGVVEHFWFQRAVSPGNWEIEFSGNVENDVFLLFETQAISDLQITEVDGTPVGTRPDGTITLFLGREYRFQSQVLDGVAQQSAVDLKTLPSLTMSLSLAGPTGPNTVSMTIDQGANNATYLWTPGTSGDVTARSRASIPGFLSPESAPVRIEVLDPTTKLTVSAITPAEVCSTCSGNEIASTVTPGGPDAKIGSFTVTADSAIDGQISLKDSDIPDYVELRDENGTPIDLSQLIDFGSDETRTFTAWRKPGVGGDEVVDGPQALEIVARPAGVWGGEAAEQPSVLKLRPPGLGMTLVHLTQPKTPGTLADGLVVPDGELVRGQFGAQYSLTDVMVAPEPGTESDLIDISLSGVEAWFIGTSAALSDVAQTGTFGFEVRPRTAYWCLCPIGGLNILRGTEARDATVTYTGPFAQQTASERLTLWIPVGNTQLSLSCLLLAFYLLLLAMFLRGILALITTQRFPSGSVVEITEGHEVPRYKRLDRGNSVWWKAWFALFTGNPDERRVVEGLRFKATTNGALLDLGKSPPPWTLERMGQTFAEIMEYKSDVKWYRIIWGDTLENSLRPTLSIRLKRRSSDE